MQLYETWLPVLKLFKLPGPLNRVGKRHWEVALVSRPQPRVTGQGLKPPAPVLQPVPDRKGAFLMCLKFNYWIFTFFSSPFILPLETTPASQGDPDKPGCTCWLLHCICLHLSSQYKRICFWLQSVCWGCIPGQLSMCGTSNYKGETISIQPDCVQCYKT